MIRGLKLSVFLIFSVSLAVAVELPGFTQDKKHKEQSKNLIWGEDVDVHINAPGKQSLKRNKETIICFYACPAGNTIDWTKGKKMEAGDDWHYDIQHIAAQTRFLRKVLVDKNLIVIYIQPTYRAWQLYDDKHPDDYLERIQKMTNELLQPFKKLDYTVTLSGHSAGGSWVLRYLSGIDRIPGWIDRIAFLDSNYNYKYDADHYDTLFVDFLNERDDTHFCVLAYNDSVALYKGKHVVSAEGGTWWNSRLMLKNLTTYFVFDSDYAQDMQYHSALNSRVQILLKENHTAAILHTVQVYRNGFIHSMLSGTEYENVGYRYYGAPAFLNLISK